MPGFKSVDDYVLSLSGWQAEAVDQLRKLVLDTAPNAEEAIKWSQPVYSENGPFCYIKAFKKHVNFGFWRGAQLDDPSGLLQSGGKKMGHVRIDSLEDIRPDVFKTLVRQAVELNRQHGDPSRGP